MEIFYAILATAAALLLLAAVMTLNSILEVLRDIRRTQWKEQDYVEDNAERLETIKDAVQTAEDRLDDIAGLANLAKEYLADISVAATEANDLFVRRGMVDEWDKEKWQQEAASVSPRYKAE